MGDLFKIKHGYAFEGKHFAVSGPFVLLTPGNFYEEGGFNRRDSKEKFYDGPVPNGYILNRGDLLIAMTEQAEGLLGSPAIVPESGLYLHNQRLGLVTDLDEEQIDKTFLYYLLNLKHVRDQIRATATGTKVTHTAPSRIYEVKACFPTVVEQKKIAGILSAYDDKIELSRQMNQTLEEIAAALFKSWFVDFAPVRAKAAGRQPEGMDAEAAALFPDRLVESEIGDIPDGWEVVGLDSIARFLNGLALQKYPPNGEESLPVIKIAQLRKGNTDGADRASAQLDPDYVVRDGDLLFSWSGSLEVELWTGGRGALNQHLFKVTSERYPKWFYFLWTRHYLPWFRELARDKATTMGHIQRRHLQEARVLLPPDAVVQWTDRLLSPIIAAIINNSIQSRTLSSLRDMLLPRLLSGETSIRSGYEQAASWNQEGSQTAAAEEPQLVDVVDRVVQSSF